MKILFWISTIIVIIANFYLFTGFVNVYFKNYNGGPSSSSASILYTTLLGLAILAGGLYCYFSAKIKWALLIMGAPILLIVLYLFFMLVLPYLMGERMN
ncbi:MAG: hypothetical protein H0X41_06345 [Chitinophagaceae bacterium]|nr:hypothetical protein [Chitinophagaceae bacterium]